MIHGNHGAQHFANAHVAHSGVQLGWIDNSALAGKTPLLSAKHPEGWAKGSLMSVCQCKCGTWSCAGWAGAPVQASWCKDMAATLWHCKKGNLSHSGGYPVCNSCQQLWWLYIFNTNLNTHHIT